MLPLKDGTVKPEGVDLTFLPLMMPEPAFRMLRHGEFDVAEMSLSWYTRTVLARIPAVHRDPGFPLAHVPALLRVHQRGERHQRARRSGRASRVGCPEYQMTAAVWLKGILADRHDVPVDSVRVLHRWAGAAWPNRDADESAHVDLGHSYRARQDPVSDAARPARSTRSTPPTSHRRFATGPARSDGFGRTPGAVEREYYSDTGIFPIMHVIVIRWDTYNANRWLATSLLKAFEESKKIATRALYETTALKYMLPFLTECAEASRRLMGDDPFSYGLQGNEETLATFCATPTSRA